MSSISNAQVTEDNVMMQRAVLTEYFRVKGHDDDFISELLTDYEVGDKLYGKAVKAKEALLKYEQAQQAQTLEQQKAQQMQTREEAQNFWSDVNSTIQDAKRVFWYCGSAKR